MAAIDPLTAGAVLLATAATDAVYVMFTSAVIARRRVPAATWSACWYLLSSYAVISYTENWVYVAFAAGSGITPMMAMLRYMDDLCLETTVTLLYCVRTSNDIIFHGELEELRARLKNFQYHLLLSQPHAEWPGRRGHINREFIENTIKETASSDFFLCGPPPFMEASRGILNGLGVKPERIMQESFGGAVPKSAQPDLVAAEPGVLVEFVRSGKMCLLRSGQTVLEAAEEQGVDIPSSCRQGQCGTCKTRLLAGNVRMDAEAGLDPDSRALGFVLTCVGHAEGAVKLDA